MLAAKASAASDEATVVQQQALLDSQATELLQLRGHLANAKAALQVQQDKARAALSVAAAATMKGAAGGAAAGGGVAGAHSMHTTTPANCVHTARGATQGGAAGPAAAVAGGGGGGWGAGGAGSEPSTSQQRQGWPAAAVEEVARLRAAADAASRDKVRATRLLVLLTPVLLMRCEPFLLLQHCPRGTKSIYCFHGASQECPLPIIAPTCQTGVGTLVPCTACLVPTTPCPAGSQLPLRPHVRSSCPPPLTLPCMCPLCLPARWSRTASCSSCRAPTTSWQANCWPRSSAWGARILSSWQCSSNWQQRR